MSDLSESARVAELRLGCPVEPWSRLGFAVSESSSGPSIHVAGLGFRFVNDATSGTESAVTGWTLAGTSHGADDVDGIATLWVDSSPRPPKSENRIHVSSIDHIVIMTGSLDRTSESIDRVLRAPRKRVRDAGGGVRQGFHRAGDIILEVAGTEVQSPSDIRDALKSTDKKRVLMENVLSSEGAGLKGLTKADIDELFSD